MSDFPFKTQQATLRELAQAKALLLDQGKRLATVEQQREELLVAAEDADECREIIGNLIENIKKHGNYSEESTLVFLDQAKSSLNCLLRAIASVKGGAA